MSYVEDEDDYGDEDQNDLMQMIKSNKEDQFMEIKSPAVNARVGELLEEIENHETAQRNAGDALASAEMELAGILDEACRNESTETPAE